MAKSYPGDTVKNGETALPSLAQAISASVKRLQIEHQGKGLAPYFDGREGKPVAESTVSRWISEPDRFPAIFLPTLVELDPALRATVLRTLTASLATDAAISSRLSAKAAGEYRAAVERLIVEEIKPGVWGRR